MGGLRVLREDSGGRPTESRLGRLVRGPLRFVAAGLFGAGLVGLVGLVLAERELWQLGIAVFCGVALSATGVTYATQRSALTPDAMLGRAS